MFSTITLLTSFLFLVATAVLLLAQGRAVANDSDSELTVLRKSVSSASEILRLRTSFAGCSASNGMMTCLSRRRETSRMVVRQ